MRYAKRAAMLAVMAAMFLVPVSMASAATNLGYEEFDDCPSKTVDPDLSLCVVLNVVGGHLDMGSKNVPITDPIYLAESVTPDQEVVVGAFDGGRQEVPGGLVGITGLNWLLNIFPASLLKLYAEAELAGSPTNPIQEPVQMPLKAHLDSPFLSNSCYIGSNTNPIALSLITGTTAPPPPNSPITGQFGEFTFGPQADVLRLTDTTLVDNSFAAPAAAGCTLLLPGLGLVDPLINAIAGLPAAAGTNEAVQDIEAAFTSVEAVYPGGFE